MYQQSLGCFVNCHQYHKVQTTVSFLERTVVINIFSHLKSYIIAWLTNLDHHSLYAKIDSGWIWPTFCMKFYHRSYFLLEPCTLFFLVSESHICMLFCRLEENEKLLLTPFEKNLDIWRQLWRVLERSDLVSDFSSLNLDLTTIFFPLVAVLDATSCCNLYLFEIF